MRKNALDADNADKRWTQPGHPGDREQQSMWKLGAWWKRAIGADQHQRRLPAAHIRTARFEPLEPRLLLSAAFIETIVADNRGLIVLTPSDTLAPVSPGAVQITTAGADNVFGTADDVTHASTVNYDAVANLLSVNANLSANERYRLRLDSSMIRTLSTGEALDGEFTSAGLPTGDGSPGGDLIIFSKPAASRIARLTTVLGDIDVNLFQDQTPISVANFLNIADGGRYDGTIIHRSVANFVVQGGGFSSTSPFNHIAVDAPIQNEPGISNLRGTLAYAKFGGDPNSATTEWFFNLGDNSSNLDNQNGGFTVFGQITDQAGLDVMDAIAALGTFNASSLQGAFTDLPLLDAGSINNASDITTSDLTLVNRVALLVDISDQPTGQLGVDSFTLTSSRGAVVTFFDLAGVGIDTIRSMVNVKFIGNRVHSVTIGKGAPANGFGVAVTGTSFVDSIKDARIGKFSSLGFIVSTAPVGSIDVKGALTGVNLNGLVVGGALLPDDIDGDGNISDLTGLYIQQGFVGSLRIGGDLRGDVVAMGGVGSLRVKGSTLGVDIMLGVTENADTPASLIFAGVNNTNLTTQQPITLLKATQWLDTTGGGESIQAPSIKRLKIAGDRRAGADGNFEPNLTLTGSPDASPALGSADIRGGVPNTTFDITGDAGPIAIGGNIRNWNLNVTGALGSLRAGSLSNVSVLVTGDVGKVVVADWSGGSIDANRIRSLTTRGDRKTGVAGDLAIDANINAPSGARLSLGPVRVKGDLKPGNWQVVGNAAGFNIQGDAHDVTIAPQGTMRSFIARAVQDSRIGAGLGINRMSVASVSGGQFAGGRINSFMVRGDRKTNDPGNFNSMINIFSLGTFSVKGDLVSSDIRLAQQAGTAPGIGVLRVKGMIDDTSVIARSNINQIFAHGMRNSDIYAGASGSISGFPGASELNPSTRILKVVLMRNVDTQMALEGSFIGAGTIDFVQIGPVNPDNGGASFGVAANTVGHMIYRDTSNMPVQISDGVNDPAKLSLGDFEVRLGFLPPAV